MKIYIGADHRGFSLKEKLKPYLEKNGYDVFDMGAAELNEKDDYPDFAKKVSENVVKDKESMGILLCGSGAGVTIAANRTRGIRAVLAHDTKILRAARADDDVNILCLGADFLSEDEAKKIIETFLKTPFGGKERHRKRIRKLDKLAS